MSCSEPPGAGSEGRPGRPDQDFSTKNLGLRRRAALFGLAAALSGCGFAPALAPGRPAAGLLGRVRADDPTDRRGHAFAARIEERLGRPGPGAWRLAYTIETAPVGVGITPAGATTRVQLTGAVRFALRAAGAEAPLLEGREESFAAYSTTDTAVATLVAEEAAETRLMRLLADRVVARLIAWPGPA